MEFFALSSAQWGVPRFITDLIALSAFGIFVSLPFILLKHRIDFKSPWAKGNALSNN